MDAADNTGAGADHVGAGEAAQQAVRYIITRPCLAEGSLSLLKYLQPFFPADGLLAFQDSRGERFEVTVDAAHRKLTGVGELYRAHNLGVNDVLLISRAEERRYLVECVVKPHARTQPAATDRQTPAAPVIEKRVVIHATPHVREVRMERVTSEPVKAPGVVKAPGIVPSAIRVEDVGPQEATRPASPPSALPTAVPHATAAPASPGPAADGPSVGSTGAVGSAVSETSAGPGTGVGSGTGAEQTVRITAAPMTSLTARLQQRPVPPVWPSAGLNSPIQMNVTAPSTVPGRPVSGHQPVSGDALPGDTRPKVVPSSVRPTSSLARNLPVGRTPQPSPIQTTSVQAITTQAAVVPASPEPAPARLAETSEPLQSQEGPNQQIQNPEDQLAALARLTGYACEHLGGGVVRLRAELGSHGYSVLIATTPQALTTDAWGESCDYMALLTPEDQRPQGIPRFTYAALEALLEHVRLAPLTPIDLRGYWNTGSFDQESVDSVAELVSAHLAQRGIFSHVLLTLAQQPAHSLVHLPRLAERLGSGVNTAELQSILETLSRPPFLALTPLPNGQYYLRSDVRDLLQELGEYAEGMRRRIRPTPVAATGR